MKTTAKAKVRPSGVSPDTRAIVEALGRLTDKLEEVREAVVRCEPYIPPTKD